MQRCELIFNPTMIAKCKQKGVKKSKKTGREENFWFYKMYNKILVGRRDSDQLSGEVGYKAR